MRSSGTPSEASRPVPFMPAAQITVVVGIVQPAAFTEPGWMSVTSISVRTSTPSDRSSCLAVSDRSSG